MRFETQPWFCTLSLFKDPLLLTAAGRTHQVPGNEPRPAFPIFLWPSPWDSRRGLGQGFATLFCLVFQTELHIFVVTNAVVKHNMFFSLKMDGGRELERDWYLVRFAYVRKTVYICMFSLLGGCVHTELLPRVERRWRGAME